MHAVSSANGRRARDQFVLNPLMIPFQVIVIDTLGDGAPDVPIPERNHASRHSSLIDRTKRSAYALAFGARTGVSTTCELDESSRAEPDRCR